jgi:hypothetical protein
MTVFKFCPVTEYACTITPLSCVTLWVPLHVCAYVRVHDWGWGSGSSLTICFGVLVTYAYNIPCNRLSPYVPSSNLRSNLSIISPWVG